jgi:hypothetical protein
MAYWRLKPDRKAGDLRARAGRSLTQSTIGDNFGATAFGLPVLVVYPRRRLGGSAACRRASAIEVIQPAVHSST